MSVPNTEPLFQEDRLHKEYQFRPRNTRSHPQGSMCLPMEVHMPLGQRPPTNQARRPVYQAIRMTIRPTAHPQLRSQPTLTCLQATAVLAHPQRTAGHHQVQNLPTVLHLQTMALHLRTMVHHRNMALHQLDIPPSRHLKELALDVYSLSQLRSDSMCQGQQLHMVPELHLLEIWSRFS